MKAEQFYEKQRLLGLTDGITCNSNPDYNLDFYQSIFRLMEDYHNFKRREELIKFDKWMAKQQFGEKVPTAEKVIDKYLET